MQRRWRALHGPGEQERILASLSELIADPDDASEASLQRRLVRGLAAALNAEFACLAVVEEGESLALRPVARQLPADADDAQVKLASDAVFSGIFQEELRLVSDHAARKVGGAEGAAALASLGLRSCAALALFDHRRQPLGALAVASRRAFQDPDATLSIARLFAGRAAAELQRERTQRRLEATEHDFRQLMEHAADGIVVTDVGGRIQFVNERICEMVGASAAELRGRFFRDFLQEDEARLLAFDHKRLSRDHSVSLLRSLRRADGSERPIEVSANRLSDGRIMAIIRDVSERLRAEQERKSYLETLALLEEAVVELDAQCRIVRVSDSWRRLFKNQSEEGPVGRPLEESIHPDYQYYLSQNLQRALKGERQQATIQAPAPLSNGSNMWLEGKFVPLQREGKVVGLRGVLRDVTLDHLNDRQISFYAYYDNLTGLPNRIRMEENLTRGLIRAEHGGQRLALGIIDLDKLDEINSSFGHRIGDKALLHVCDQIRAAPGGGENLYRWSGDKFVVILSELSDLDTLKAIGARLVDACQQSLDVEGEQIRISCSIGFAVYPDDGLTAEILMGQADRALSHAKAQGGSNYQLARSAPQKGLQREQLAMRNRLATAIANREITAFF
ncbi:MAG: diguanylate cyclase [Leptospirales bacterium]|nr:diguanylate cyclase [Leptospirales bacterium]